ncbi:6-pyruvoyltetrahydropterin/6-carboxytetrahydropterin synthase [Propionispira arboris]|jgi:6-pyruvoyltetrahydropterin/6-carboxytetrahydropterin synthase|uniref:6-carboxy-5,6,7,8-tetrahydropterin synthase n=1 Tax=Propionispira arboris TaxID=84035 RepID=A0A1H6WDW9_9FIRM|nr:MULTISPECIES: 6-carboxytetrahydropterin synthase QueD [Propionispira]SEJ12297.1 6-pyruvoyltetrahydropterin/6-carboxytetrahydropterin synthase [Propionispira arboris]
MFELTVIVEFEAAHRIVGYPGKCNRLHGHNWSIEVSVVGNKLNELGMLVDFKELKQEVNKIMDRLDHQYLNELPIFQENNNPTAENIAIYIYNELENSPLFEANSKVKTVKVWESQKSAVSYSKGE